MVSMLTIRRAQERGHANHLADDWTSTAYWYQRLPSPAASLAAVAERLPVRTATTPAVASPPPEALTNLPADRAAARAAAADRLTRLIAERNARLAALAEAARSAEVASREEVRDLRRRTLG